MEVLIDVIIFTFSALKHATAVVLHALHESICSLRTVVLELLATPGDAEGLQPDGADEVSAEADTDGRASKREALIRNASRWLHVVFELYYQVKCFVSPRTLAALEDVVVLLYPHSSVYIQPKLRAEVAVSEPATLHSGDTVTSGMDVVDASASLNEASSEVGSSLSDIASDQHSNPSATDLLSLCAAKWGRPKLPRSDLGKRAKGYFAVRGSSAAASTTTVPLPVLADSGAPDVVMADSELRLSSDGMETSGLVVGNHSSQTVVPLLA